MNIVARNGCFPARLGSANVRVNNGINILIQDGL